MSGSCEDHPKSNLVVGCGGLSTHFLVVHPFHGLVMFCNGKFCEQNKSKNDYKSWACGKGGFIIV
jgi:hypothetical protein